MTNRERALNIMREWKDGDYLDLSGLGLTEIPKEIEWFVNLKLLLLDNNKISDLRPLTRLVNLELLYLEDNNIQDVAPLAYLTKLEFLTLTNNNIQNVKALTPLTCCEIEY